MSLTTTLITQFWNEAKIKFQRNILGVQPELPWMKQREIDLLTHLLKEKQPKKVLEWGSGYGTVHFPKLLDDVQWIAVEHDKDWAQQITLKLDRTKASVEFIPPEQDDWSSRDPDGSYEDFKSYVERPATFGKFDLIIVDGRARTECLKIASEIMESDGLVFLHDANRERYLQYSSSYNDSLWLTDYRDDAGGVWLGTSQQKLGFDLSKFERIFRLCTKSRWVKLLNL